MNKQYNNIRRCGMDVIEVRSDLLKRGSEGVNNAPHIDTIFCH